MAQSTILAAAKTAATSTDVTVGSGSTVTIGLFSSAYDRVPAGAIFTVYQDTPGADNVVTTLTDERRSVVLSGPGTFRVGRVAYSTGTAFGVFSES